MNMKTKCIRWLAVIVCVALSLSLAACDGSKTSSTNTITTTQAQKSESAQATDGSGAATGSETVDLTDVPGETETMDQDDLDIQAAKAKQVYTKDDLTEDDVRLENIVASCAGNTINNRDAQLYYALQFYSFMNNYGSIAPYFGLDASQPLSAQTSTVSDLNWEQYFLMSAMDDFHRYAALAAKASSENFSMSEEYSNQLADVRDGLQERYAEYGFDTADAYIQSNFGVPVRCEDYVRYLELYFAAISYQESIYNSITVSDEELNDYYNEHQESFKEIDKDQHAVNVRHILIMPNAAEDASEAEQNAAKESAKAKAEELLAAFQANPSEEAFAELAKQNSEDPGSKENGGLYENVVPGRMEENFNDWCFDASRKPGETGIVETSYGYHIMYFVSTSEEPYWMIKARESLMSDILFDRVEAILAEYPMTTNYDDAVLAPLPK